MCFGIGSDGLTVEACVGTWKSIFVTVITMNIESTEAIHAFQLLEAVERDFACSSDELQQLSTLFLVVRTDSTPEPLNLRGGGGIVVILGVALPIIDIDLGKTGDQEF